MARYGYLLLAIAMTAGAMAVALSGCNLACAALGCPSEVSAKVNLPTATVVGAQVVACRLDRCATATLPAPSGDHFMGVGVTFSKETPVQGFLWTDPGGIHLDVEWGIAAPPPRNGDSYTVTVIDSTGATLRAVEGTATYQTSHPNGDGCPPTCHRNTNLIGDP
jgi:hypothetical protein